MTYIYIYFAEDNEVPSLSNINPEEVKTVLHKMATDTMSSYQVHV